MVGRHPHLAAFFLSLVSLSLFLAFSAQGIYGGDSGDLVTGAYLHGIPHPPGYPFYTFLGWILTRLPIFSVSSRVGLLSSFPHAFVVGLVFLLIFRLTRKPAAAVFAALGLAGNYLFFLYAVTPEVFALLDLFVVVILYLLLRWSETKKSHYLYLASFVFGLSLAHQQVILFFVPALGFWLWQHRELTSNLAKPRVLASFLFGLLPYLYLPLAARGNSIINWDRPVDFAGFIRLVTRADYGTFVSGGFYGVSLYARLLQLKAYFELALTDITWVGVILAIFGFWWLGLKMRKFWVFLFLAFVFLGPVFFFYASFPLLNRFNIGTYERFLLPSYLVIYVFIGVGFWQTIEFINRQLIGRISVWRLVGRPAVILIFFLYPLTALAVTGWKFVGFPADRTAENLGRDILGNLPAGSILLLGRDTPLFITQYVRYALGVRKDVIVLQASLLSQESYPAVIGKNFPGLILPAKGADFPLAFVKANRDQSPIFSNTQIGLDLGWFWVPYGLVYQLTKVTELPSLDNYYQKNLSLWSKLHDPRDGILSRFNHLMLSDIRDVYNAGRLEFGRILLKAGRSTSAHEQLEKALAYGGDTQISETYILLGLTELFSKNCSAALAYFQKAKATAPAPDKVISLYEGLTWRDCARDPGRAQQLFDEYERLRQAEETQLQ